MTPVGPDPDDRVTSALEVAFRAVVGLTIAAVIISLMLRDLGHQGVPVTGRHTLGLVVVGAACFLLSFFGLRKRS
jgi:sterol desaturase/sphingolipid hydroxylase (fatty acid hydroxylase superfamily)